MPSALLDPLELGLLSEGRGGVRRGASLQIPQRCKHTHMRRQKAYVCETEKVEGRLAFMYVRDV